MRKLYEKWIDEDTMITAKVSSEEITLKNKHGSFNFIFKNSKRAVVKKILEAIARFAAIKVD